MATSGTYVTPEGIERKLAGYWVRQNRPTGAGTLNTLGALKTIELEVDLSDLPASAVNFNVDRNNDGTLDGFSSNDPFVPANSSIVSCSVFTSEIAAGGTDFDIGLFKVDGTAVDHDGLATVVAASMSVVGERYVGAGVLITPATSASGADDAVIGLTTNGTFTAGKVSIVVEYTENN